MLFRRVEGPSSAALSAWRGVASSGRSATTGEGGEVTASCEVDGGSPTDGPPWTWWPLDTGRVWVNTSATLIATFLSSSVWISATGCFFLGMSLGRPTDGMDFATASATLNAITLSLGFTTLAFFCLRGASSVIDGWSA
ncbi:hypothetical protein H257_04391 [Aphanomyces astaci]|uniref:Uncharacterized protein n=1 Tax=Aphanomyces astaci TaxID=112090 RepID=W4GVQ9_APHAT|nr:hypothetical protein H257_04391 [Aphanomyces astaci]ETV83762.1 hypothetical protein H257_04391 [Aphanomyces astaci]|eukprot:XP_009827192.1 hypothetical protein H257_04391 [Aphanomyces astaci]